MTGGTSDGTGDAGDGRPFRILVVCTANLCRSPMAQLLLRQAFDERGAGEGFAVQSAGTRAADGSPMDPESATALRGDGVDTTGFRSRPLTDDLCRQADLILTATREHRSQVLQRVPLAMRRSFTLLEFAAAISLVRAERPEIADPAARVRVSADWRSRVQIDSWDVVDPFRHPEPVHRAVADTIRSAARTVAAGLASGDQGKR